MPHIWSWFKKPLIITFVTLCLFLIAGETNTALAAVRTWDGGGTDGTCGGAAGDGNKWSCAANWSSDTLPGSSDVATFDSTSTKDATVDSSFAGSVQGVDINSGYTGTITQSRSLTVGSSSFDMAAGTWSSGSNAIDINDGSFILSSGSFTAPSSTLTIERNITITGGTFTHNSGTVTIDGNSGSDDSTLACNNVTFNSFNISKGTSFTLLVTVGSNCSLPLGNSASSVARSGIVNNGTITVGTGTWTINGGYTQNTGAALTFTGTTIDVDDGGLVLSGGTFTANSMTTLNFERNLTNTAGILPSNLTVLIDGSGSSDSTTLACNNVTFSSVTITKGTAFDLSVTVGSDCSLPLGNSPTSVALGGITNNGTITVGTGTWTASGGYTSNTGAVLTMSGTTLTLDRGDLILNGGTFPQGITTINLDQDLDNDADLLPDNITLNILGTTSGDSSNLSCNNATFSLVTINKTVLSNFNVTFGSDCTIPLGNSPSTSVNGATITNNGTVTAGTGTWTVDGSYVQSSGSTTFTGTAMDINDGGLTVSGGTFTASSMTTLSLERNLTLTGTLLPSGLALTIDGTQTADDSTVSCGSTTFGSMTINKTTSTSETTFASDCTVTGAFTRTDGPVLNSSSAYTLTVQGAFSMSQVDSFGGSNLTVRLSGGSSQNITQNAANVFFSPFEVNKSGGTATLQTTFTVSTSSATIAEGNFDVNGKSLTCTGGLTVQDGGTFILVGSETPTTPTLSSGSTVSYKGDGDSSSDTYSIKDYTYHHLTLNATDGTSDTFNLTSNETLGGTLNVTAGTLGTSGASTLTVTGLITVNGGTWTPGALDVTANAGMTVSSGTFTGSSGDVDVNGTLTISNGVFTAPTGTFTVSGNFNHSGGTFTHNSSTLSLDGTSQQLLGDTTFNNLTKTVSSADTLTFEATKTQTVSATMTFQGASGQLLSLRSSSTGTQWKLDPQGTRTISFLDVKDSNNINATEIAVSGNNITDSGNNTNWAFATPTPTPTNTPTPTPTSAATPTPTQPGTSTNQPEVATTSCTYPPPQGPAPQLYAASTQGTSVTLYFTDATGTYTSYAVEYGYAGKPYQFSALTIAQKGARTAVIAELQAHTSYTFRIRPSNNCAPGPWSNAITTTTKSLVAFNQLQLTAVEAPTEIPSEKSSEQKTCSYTVKPGDSLWSIASEKLGNGSSYTKLVDLNKQAYPSLEKTNSLDVGWKLAVCSENATEIQDEKVPASENLLKKLEIKIIDNLGQPLINAKVTLHSTPKETITDENGVATFSYVERGQHELVVEHDNFQGKQNLYVDDKTENLEMTVTVKPVNVFLDPYVIGAFGFLLMIIGLLSLLLLKTRRQVHTLQRYK